MNRFQQQSLQYGIIGGVSLILIALLLWFMWGRGKMDTYETAQYRIRYPSGWEVKKNAHGADVIFMSPLGTALDVFRENVNVVVQKVDERHRNIKDYTTVAIDQLSYVFKDSIKIKESKSVNVSGEVGYRFSYIGTGEDTSFWITHVWILIPETSTAYQITFTALESTYEEYLPMAQKIIRSFKIR